MASVVGDPPVLFRQYELRGSANTVGNTVMSYEHDPRINSLLLDPQWTRSELRDVPLDATVEAAYVFYSARMDQQVDYSFELHRPDGAVDTLTADSCQSLLQFGEVFYYCRRDVTEQLEAVEASLGELNGFYNVYDFDARPGELGSLSNGCHTSDVNCQAAYGGWSLVIFWSSPSYPKVRNLNLYDGFLAMYEDHSSGISPPIQLSGFEVGDPAVGEIAFFALEGDPHLGHPPLGPEWADFMYFEAEDGTRERLQDAINPPGNLFNSTVPDSGVAFNGIDLDRFDIGEGGMNLLSPGQTTAWIQPGSGDGIPNYEGEFFILSWVMLAIDTIAPSFDEASSKVVDRTTAAEGDTLTYTITVENSGSQIATDVVVQDLLPDGTEYVTGSTTLDGQPVDDIGGQSALEQGINIGTLDYRPGTVRSRTLSWKVHVESGASDGAQICNTATVDANEAPLTTLETDPCTTISAPEIVDPPLLTVESRDGDPVEPGHRLRYRAIFSNEGAQAARNLSYTQDLPPYVRDLDIVSVPSGTTDSSSATGGANGTGFIDISSITVPGAFTVEIVFDVELYTYSELVEAGVPPASVDGLVISTQGILDAPWLDDALATDDPTTPSWPDPTDVVLSWTTDLSSSTKTGEDLDGAPLEPGDVVEYEIAVTNTGQAPATAHLVDDLPEGVESCSILEAPGGAACTSAGGANGTGQLTLDGFVVEPDEPALIRYTVSVRDDVEDGTIVQNQAVLTLDESNEVTNLSSSPLEVFARPLLHTSTKAVAGHVGRMVEPGDELSYTITVSNTGNMPATNVTVEDRLPPSLSAVEVGQGGEAYGQDLLWEPSGTPALSSIAPDESVTLTFTAGVAIPLDDGTEIANQADIYADEVPGGEFTGDADTPDPDDPTVVTVTSSPELETTIKSVENLSGGMDEVRPGHTLLYTITVRNTGNAIARDVEISDPVDAHLVDIEPMDGGVLIGDTLRWQVGDVGLSPEGDVTVRFEATVVSSLPDGTEIPNQAEVLADGMTEPTLSGDPSTPDLDDPTVVIITSEAVLESTKAVTDLDGAPTMPGDRLEYQIVLISAGDAPVRDITVVDPVEACLTDVQSFDGGVFDGSSITWTHQANSYLSSLESGHAVELRFRATVAPGTPDGTECANQAFAGSPDLEDSVPSGDPTTAPPDDPTIVTVESRPVLERSTKAVELLEDRSENNAFSPGDRVRYTLSIDNTGTETASDVVVTDPIPDELINVSVSSPGVISGGVVTWSLGDVSAGDSVTLLLDGDLEKPLDDGTIVENQASIESGEMDAPALTGDPSTPDLDDPTVMVLVAEPVLEQTTKAVSFPEGEPARPGHELDYLVTVRNTGTSLARDVVVTDVLDENLELIEVGDGGSYEPSTRTVTWSLGTVDLSPEGDRTLSLRVQLATPLDNGTIVDNQALVSADELADDVPSHDPRTPDLGDPTRVIVVAGSDVTASTKIVDAEDGVVTPGQELTWTITVRNDGDAIARNVVVTDEIDPSLVDIEAGQGGELSQGEITWSASTTPELLNLAPEESVELTFASAVARPLDDGTIIENQALITADDIADPVPTTDPGTPAPFDPTRVTVESAPALTASTKVPDVDTARPGDTITWTIRVINDGDMIARDVTVTDQLDPNLELVSASAGGAYDPDERTVTWTVDEVDLSPDGEVELELRTSVAFPLDDGTVVANQAFVHEPSISEAAPTSDPRTSELADPSEVEIEAEPELVFTKQAENLDGGPGDGQAEPGDRIRYTLTVENEGDMVAWGTAVSDVVDENLVDVMVDDGGAWEPASRTVSWPAADVAPDEALELGFTASVAPLTAGGIVIENQADAASGEQTVVSSDVSAPGSEEPTIIEVVAAPVLSASTKSVTVDSGDLVRPGDHLTWTIVVENTGNTYATDVVVEDPVDDWLVDVVPGQGGVFEGGQITWKATTTPELAEVSPEEGSEVTLTFGARIREDAPDGTVIPNQAVIRAEEIEIPALTGDPDTPDPDDPTTITVSIPVIETSKTVVNEDGEDVAPGDLLRWTVEVRNLGSHEATHVLVTDEVDTEHLVEIEPDEGGSFDGESISWSLGTIEPGEADSVSFTSRVRPLLPDGTEIANQAFVGIAEIEGETPSFDPSTPAPDDPTVVTVVASPDFRGATKEVENLTGSDDRVRPGDRLRYTLVFTNTGNTLATGAEIRDVIDPNLIDVTLEPAGSLEGEIAVWNEAHLSQLASVAPGDVIVVHLEGEVLSPLEHGTQIANQGQLVSVESEDGWWTGDPRTPAEADPTVVEVWSAPRMRSSEKSVVNLDGSVDAVEAGDVLEYTLVIVNDGTEDAVGATLVDSVPSWTDYEPGSTMLNGEAVPDEAGGASPLASGVEIQSSRPGTPPGVLLVDDGEAPDDETAVVVFRVRVSSDVPGGTAISNQGFVSCSRTDPAGTGDPRTPETGDPTLAFVGEVVHLSGSTKGWSLVEDFNTPGVVEPGDSVAYEFDLVNRGNVTAFDVNLTDEIPTGAEYISGTLTLDGEPLTDHQDGDGGSVVNSLVSVRLAELLPRERAEVRFEVRVLDDAGPTLVNQGDIKAVGPAGEVVRELTDADPSTPGALPTVIPIGEAPVRDISTSTKSVVDMDGGRVEPGDSLRYTITVRNSGNVPLEGLTIVDDVPAHTSFVRAEIPSDAEVTFDTPPAGEHERGRLLITSTRVLDPGESMPISFVVNVDGEAPLGALIDNFATIEADETPTFETNNVRLIVGGAPGTGGFAGRVYRDLEGTGRHNAQDPVFPGFRVRATPLEKDGNGDDDDGSFVETIVDDDGHYLLLGLRPAPHEISFYSPSGTRFSMLEDRRVVEDQIAVHDGLIDPSGIVYRVGTADAIPGATVWLLYDDSMIGEAPLPCDDDQSPIDLVTDPAVGASEESPLPRPVGAGCLPEGQQSQSTPQGEAEGFYRFDVPESDLPTAYRLFVQPPAPRLAFPSTTSSPEPGFAPAGPIVESPTPDPAAETEYWLRFRIGTADDEVTNNHVPLDALESLVDVRKVAGRSTATVGELIPYTITVTNRSEKDIEAAGGAGGGLAVRDIVPEGMRYVRGTSMATRFEVSPDGTREGLCPRLDQEATGCASRRREPTPLANDSASPTIGQVLDYGPFDLPAGQSMEIRYGLVVAADAEPGERTNRASALLDNVFLAEARAAVRIVPDPLFDLATLYGKVYCDEAEDGNQEPGDRGLPGVRIHADIGHYAVTDGSGKWHLQRLPAGMRLLKVDERTLPPGVTLLDHAARSIYVTPGLDTTISWRATCDLDQVAPEAVSLLVERAAPELTLIGNAMGLGMTVADEPVPVLRANARLETSPAPPSEEDSSSSPRLVEPDDDLYFHTKVTGPIQDWRLVMAEVPRSAPARTELQSWPEVFSTGGSGRPPDYVELLDGASELDPGRSYAYWLLVVGVDGVAARSPVRTMVIYSGADEETALVEAVLDEREGPLFEEGEDGAPTSRLKEGLSPAMESLSRDAGYRLRVGVHMDASFGESAKPLSEARASALLDWLRKEGIDEERTEVVGLGSSAPVVPNIGSRNEATNRRVEVSVLAPPAPKPDVAELVFEPRAVVAGVGTVVPDEKGAFRLRLPVPEDGRVIAGLRRSDGATLGAAFLVDREGRLVDVDEDRAATLAGYARAAAEGSVPKVEPARKEADPSISPADPAPGDEQDDGTPIEVGPRRYAVSLHLPLETVAARLDIAGRRVDLPLLELTMEAHEDVVRLDDEGELREEVVFSVASPTEAVRWRLKMGEEEDSLHEVASGEGTPPERLTWDGAGVEMSDGSSLIYRLIVEDSEGNEGRSAPKALLAAAEPHSETHRELIEGSDVSDGGLEVLESLVERVLSVGEGATLRVEAHTDSSGGEDEARRRTDSVAEAVERALVRLGAPPDRVESRSRGASNPMLPNTSRRNRSMNNRVVFELEPPPPMPPALEPVARVVVGELEARRETDEKWVAELEEMPRSLRLDVSTDDGRQAVYRVTVPIEEERREDDTPSTPLSLAASWRERSDPEASAGGGGGLGRRFSRLLSRSRNGGDEGAVLAQGTLLGDDDLAPIPATEQPDDVPRDDLVDPADPRDRREEEPVEKEARRTVDPDEPRELEPEERDVEMVHERRAIGDVDLSAVPAARTVVHLPRAGSVIESDTLGLAGETAPGNTVAVNGREVDVGVDGRFFAVVDLPRGDSTVVVQVTDPDGNEAAVSRDLVSDPDGLFVLAMADTHAGSTGAELAGVTDRTRVGIGPVYLHGRGVAYAKGSWRMEQGPFEELDLTLHLDSAKEPEASYFADLIAPHRHYPVYGDSADEVQDVAAMGPLYLSLEADSNQLRLGNFQTDPGVGGLFRYRRSFHGARLKLDQPHLDGDLRTRGEIFVAGDPAGVQPGHVVMQGTGGSLYFLRHRDIVEGSERVRVVVRDRDTGVELATRPLTRNVDYVVHSREGHLMLMSPLPSVVEAGWMAGMSFSNVLDGNPVFLVVDYEHVAGPGDSGLAAGGYVTESIFDWLKLGGGFLSQTHGGGADPYRLFGLSLEARARPSTFLRAEMARSSGADVSGFYSADGGLSFASLLPECLGNADSPLCRDGGSAYKLEAGATLGDLMGEQDDIVRMGAHLHFQDRGFYGSQLLLDHGQRRLGTTLSWDISDKDVLSARLDRVASDVPLGDLTEGVEDTREVVRGYGGLRYERREERFKASGEYLYGRVRDPAMDEGEQVLNTHRLAAGGEYDATERLALVLEQDLVLGGDRRLFDAWNDRLATTLGARWLLTESLRLSALGQVRWNGETSALVGAETKTGDHGSVYARQRLTRMTGGAGWRAQSVVGGEQQILPGMRSYGEYQLAGGMSGRHGRALVGLSNEWEVREGVTLGLNYERAQVLGDPGLGPAAPGATLDPLSDRLSTSGRVDGQVPFDSAGFNPAGAFYPGATSRDAISAGVEVLTDPVRGSARLEVRYDNADDELAGTMPGVADRLQTVALANVVWGWTRDLSAVARLNYAGTTNRTRRDEGLEGREALWLEATGGLAFRPESYDWVNVLAKYTKLIDQRPLDLTAGIGDRHSSHVLSVAPVVKTPWRATISEKVAYKNTRMRMGLGDAPEDRPPEAAAHTILWINRLDLHVLPRFDLTGEYRVLWVGAEDAAARADGERSITSTVDSGLVFEVAWRAAENLRLGVGYSFARFGDDELSRFDRDERGPFLRITGMY